MQKLSKVVAVAMLTALCASSCTGNTDFRINGMSVEAAAEQLIEGELGDLLALDLEGNCPALDDPQVGTTFECTGTTAENKTAQFTATVERDDFVNVVSTNVIQAALVPNVEEAAINALLPQTGPVELDCGTKTLILDANDGVVCEVSDGTESRDVLLTFSSLDPIQFTATIQ